MKAIFLSLFFVSVNSFADVRKGDIIPPIKGTNQEGKSVQLRDFSRKYLLVYFYPKADTPGCTKQACSLRDSYAILQKKGVKILGVSTDTVESQKAFKEKFKLPFDLIADTEKVWTRAFGVDVTMGLASRQAFLFRDAKLVWLDRNASTEEQAHDVLEFLK